MVRVGVIDSGGPPSELQGALAFTREGAKDASHDRIGHGTVVSGIIRRSCPSSEILHAQVFEERPVTNAVSVASALNWLSGVPGERRADVACLSLGLAADQPILRQACVAATEAGMMLVAAHPARGSSCYPAAYPMVIGATGDARCGWNDLSHLGPKLFGAWNNSPEQCGKGMSGASLAAARVAGHLAQLIVGCARPVDWQEAITLLSERSRLFGCERRRS